MNQKKIKKLRKLARMMCKSTETTYNVGKPRIDYHGEDIEAKGGGILKSGMRLEAGVPTTMQHTCLKFITKKLKA